MFSLLHSQMNWKKARLKSTTSPQICCCTTLWKLNVQLCSYLWTKTATFRRSLTGRAAPKQPGLKPRGLCCLGCPSRDGVPPATIYFSRRAENCDRHSGRNYHSASSTARSINGVAGWNAWSNNKEHISNTASEHRCHYVWHWWPPNLPP